jgi:hypothetical protein
MSLEVFKADFLCLSKVCIGWYTKSWTLVWFWKSLPTVADDGRRKPYTSNILREESNMIERRRKGNHALNRNTTVTRFEADDAAECCWPDY